MCLLMDKTHLNNQDIMHKTFKPLEYISNGILSFAVNSCFSLYLCR